MVAPLQLILEQSDIAVVILSFLDVLSLIKSRKICRSLRKQVHTAAHLYLWKSLVVRRWRVKDSVLRSIGAADWRNAYEILHLRQKPPMSPYFEKHRVVFATGRKHGVDAWLTVAHTPDSRIRHGYIDLRIGIQNAFSDSLVLEPAAMQLKVRSLIEVEHTNVHLETLRTKSCYVVAWNGRLVDADESLATQKELMLGSSDFVVCCCRVTCPADVLNEVEFLTRAESCSIPICVYRESEWRSVELVVRFKDELAVWDHFTELPGGVVLLNAAAPLEIY